MLIKIGDAWIDPGEIAAVKEGNVDIGGTHYTEIVLRQNTGPIFVDAPMDEAEAALIDAGYIENPYPEEDEPELSEEARVVLTGLYDCGFEFMARDKDGKLYAFRTKPEKGGAYWYANDGDKAMRVEEGFDFIDFDDEKPWSIAYLLLGP